MPGTLSGRYRLVTELGRGGMGVVWEAYDELLHRSVAVKEVHYPIGMSPDDRSRLAAQTLREARAVAAVDTTSAVRVFDVVEQDGKPWLVMELVRGGTLTDAIRAGGALPSHEVARIGLAVLTALETAHQAGVLHRDVKPSNVLIGDDGRIALTDFGIATVDSDPSETTSGLIVGSPSYISPERAKGAKPTAASDFWSLGATLWTAAEGRAPYDGETAFAVLSSVANDEPPLCANCDDDLRTLLATMMSPVPANRPAASQIRAQLERVLQRPERTIDRPTAVLRSAFDRTTVLAADGGGLRAAADAPVAEARGAGAAPPPAYPPRAAPPPTYAPRAAAPAPAAVRTPTSVRPAERRRRWGPIAALLGLVALVVAGILVWRANSNPTPSAGTAHHHRHGVKTSATSDPAATSRPSATGSPTSVTTAQHAGPVPAGFTRYVDPTYGWSVAVPDGWSRSDTSGGTQFTDPAGGRYVLFGTRYPAGSSAIGAWRSQEQSFRSDHADYQRLRLQTVPVPGASDAADWEFTYTDGGAGLHALDRGMVYGTRGYGIYFQTHTDQWDSSTDLLNTILTTYRPGRTGA